MEEFVLTGYIMSTITAMIGLIVIIIVSVISVNKVQKNNKIMKQIKCTYYVSCSSGIFMLMNFVIKDFIWCYDEDIYYYFIGLGFINYMLYWVYY